MKLLQVLLPQEDLQGQERGDSGRSAQLIIRTQTPSLLCSAEAAIATLAAAVNFVVLLRHWSSTLWLLAGPAPFPVTVPNWCFGRGALYRCQVAQRRRRNNTLHSTGRQRVGALQLSKERAAIHSAAHNAEPDTAKPNRSNPALSDGADKAHLNRRCPEADLRTGDLEVSRVAPEAQKTPTVTVTFDLSAAPPEMQ